MTRTQKSSNGTAPPKKPASPDNNIASAAKQLNEIRNLLFSETVDDMQHSMQASFERQEQEIQDIKALIKDNAEQITKQLNQHVAQLEKNIEKEHQLIIKTKEKFSEQLKELKQEMKQEFKQSRSWAESEHDNIYGELAKKHQAMTQDLSQVSDNLTTDKASRDDLALMFNQLASSLSGSMAQDDNSSKSNKRK